MTSQSSQGVWAPSGATVRIPRLMCLAPSESERLWKGLERFVNCDDSLSQFQALGRAFSSFWPVKILLWTPDTDEATSKQVAWHPACHRLFLLYRDALRALWCRKPTGLPFDWEPHFLLGVDRSIVHAYIAAREPADSDSPLGLVPSWQDILQKFPTAVPDVHGSLEMLWGYGDFLLLTQNDFSRAFYLLFRQSWRARVCPRCKMFFIARKPKQTFCGTSCSAGSRLASNRKWWNAVGSKRRTNQRRKSLNRNHRERKHP
jgi:hypothetical protein